MGLILKFKLLKKLNINNISEIFFVSLVKELPVLEKVRVTCSEITPQGILKVLECGRCLTDLIVVIDFHMEFDLDVYNSILTAARGRVRVLLMIRRTERIGAEQQSFLNTNRKWLNICYF